MKKLIPRIALALALVAGSAAELTVHSQPALADSQMRSPICGAAIAPGALATAQALIARALCLDGSLTVP